MKLWVGAQDGCTGWVHCELTRCISVYIFYLSAALEVVQYQMKKKDFGGRGEACLPGEAVNHDQV